MESEIFFPLHFVCLCVIHRITPSPSTCPTSVWGPQLLFSTRSTVSPNCCISARRSQAADEQSKTNKQSETFLTTRNKERVESTLLQCAQSGGACRTPLWTEALSGSKTLGGRWSAPVSQTSWPACSPSRWENSPGTPECYSAWMTQTTKSKNKLHAEWYDQAPVFWEEVSVF